MDTRSWSAFVDSVAGPLRLEPPRWQSYGLLATLHLVDRLWGELALFRAAHRLLQVHGFDLENVLGAQETPGARVWYGHFLTRCACAAEQAASQAVPLPSGLMKPAWTAQAGTGAGKQS